MAILGFALCFLPMMIGIMIYDQLPARIVSHFSITFEPDGYTSRFNGVFVLPLVMAGVEAMIIFLVEKDPLHKNHSNKITKIIYLLIPALNILFSCASYYSSIDRAFDIKAFITVIMGILFVIIGNFIPKMRHNYTMGIRTPWTLADKYTWEKTHQLSGPLWVLGGSAIVICGIFDLDLVLITVLAAIVVIPIVYSYLIFRKREIKK